MSHDLNPNKLPDFTEIWLNTLQWEPSGAQQLLFSQLYQKILLGNDQLNLTRITEADDFWEKHLWDSLAGLIGLVDKFPEKASVIDIGTGGGFPGLPVAIAYPSWQVTLLDATRKKITFLSELIEELNLDNVDTITGRAEEIAHNKLYRQVYDFALIRAVGSPSVCAEYALPFVKEGGLAILYRGHWSDEDATNLSPALKELGATLEAVYRLSTPLSESDRNCVYLRKIAPTKEEYPRAIGIPTQQPL